MIFLATLQLPDCLSDWDEYANVFKFPCGLSITQGLASTVISNLHGTGFRGVHESHHHREHTTTPWGIVEKSFDYEDDTAKKTILRCSCEASPIELFFLTGSLLT